MGKSRRQVLHSSLFGLFISDDFFVTLTQGVECHKMFLLIADGGTNKLECFVLGKHFQSSKYFQVGSTCEVIHSGKWSS